MDEVVQAQVQIGRAIRRARAGEDPALAARVREEGDRLARVLSGVLGMARLHALDNRAFDQPLRDLGGTLAKLVELLGSVHLLTVEDHVYVNDVRIRLEGGDVGAALAARLVRHASGGLSFHKTLADSQLRTLVAALAAEPTAASPRAALERSLRDQDVAGVEVERIHRFRLGQESGRGEARSTSAVVADGLRLVEESWTDLAAERLPNPLPLRRLVAELMQMDDQHPAYWCEAAAPDSYGAHLVRVLRLALLMGRGAGLSASSLQDLGVAALFHDVGYADVASVAGLDGAQRLERHGVTGARLLLRQRGFHEAKLRRARAALEHHRRYDDARRRPALFARILAIAEDYDTLTQLRGGALSPHEALARMLAAAGTIYDPVLLRLLINTLGCYPPGTLLRLEDGSVARVEGLVRSPEDFARPMARIERLSENRAPTGETRIDLAQAGGPGVAEVIDPKEAAEWPAPVEPIAEPPAPEALAQNDTALVEALAPAGGPAVAHERTASQPSSDAGCTARLLYQGVLADVLRELYLSRRTGVLLLTRGGERRSVRIWKGNVIHASSNMRSDHLGEVAVREGLLAQADLDRANEVTAREKKRLGVALRELGIMDEQQLERALAAHAREVIVKAFSWTDGYGDFEEQEAAPSWFTELALGLSTPDLILEAVRRIDDPDVVRYQLGDIDRLLRLSVDPAIKSLPLSLVPLDGFVLSRVDGHISAREVIRIVPGEPEDVQRSLLGLLSVGTLEYLPRPDAGRPVQPVQ